ncbi:hypothetical protein HanRHA438_Chr09g0395991 [Helianthus annuus]|nr:hypothetical protein HanHA300_Chr09g0315481 [Helianthus annuus]KAJ0542126.1 hypothetical protein HanHA89_Chr09g0336381 [Helianthus annuus]KAJ0707185.1 hypothetical protein HanLR1_Chr09g0315691 [Helianthus annuus]KAJ0887891.1 hypothetical protein HanRHA438_Chr09g0395991 [Helianthus annuus]KAJ0892815.1 hypothetical protein HanPSC8_Chr09g0370451 [Helianthus annuus]
MPDEAALNAVLPEGKGDLGDLGDPAATGVPKETVVKFGDRRQPKKKSHEAVSVPTLVPEVAGILRTRLRKYEDYVVVSDTLEGLGVPDGSAATGASTTGTKPVDDKKQKAAASVAGGEKAPKFRKTRATAVPKTKPAVTTGKLIKCFASFVAAECLIDAFSFCSTLGGTGIRVCYPPSSPKVVDVETQKKGDENPSIEVQLEREKAAFEKLKQTERWVASAGLKQVRSLAKLLSDERKLWKEACDRENEKLFRVRQELNNLKAANAALVKEKAAAEAAVKEAESRGATALKEAEARAAQELADANADRITLNKVAEVQNRVTILEEVSSRATEAEAQANRAAEARDGLTTSLGQVTVDHAWMREHVIEHIVETILDAPENATVVAEMKSVHVRLGSRLVTTNALAM